MVIGIFWTSWPDPGAFHFGNTGNLLNNKDCKDSGMCSIMVHVSQKCKYLWKDSEMQSTVYVVVAN